MTMQGDQEREALRRKKENIEKSIESLGNNIVKSGLGHRDGDKIVPDESLVTRD